MRKVFYFLSPRERYKCDAAVVWCYDHRFEAALRKLLKRLGVVRSDPIRVAGGAKVLADPDLEGDRQFILKQLRWSIKLHGTDTVLLMVHSDCGAYGGLAAFDGDATREMEHHKADLERAADALKQAIPELTVKTYFVDFDGVWEPDEPLADPKSGKSSRQTKTQQTKT